MKLFSSSRHPLHNVPFFLQPSRRQGRLTNVTDLELQPDDVTATLKNNVLLQSGLCPLLAILRRIFSWKSSSHKYHLDLFGYDYSSAAEATVMSTMPKSALVVIADVDPSFQAGSHPFPLTFRPFPAPVLEHSAACWPNTPREKQAPFPWAFPLVVSAHEAHHVVLLGVMFLVIVLCVFISPAAILGRVDASGLGMIISLLGFVTFLTSSCTLATIRAASCFFAKAYGAPSWGP